jgi:hypothetical protein
LAGPVPAEQWKLPVGFKDHGQALATLAEVVNPHVSTLSLADADDDSRHKLIAERFAMKPDSYRIHLVGAGVVDKARAIEEVKAQTPTGKLLEEIEQRVVNNMINKAMLKGVPKDISTKPPVKGGSLDLEKALHVRDEIEFGSVAGEAPREGDETWLKRDV